jgi:hypothetical protein
MVLLSVEFAQDDLRRSVSGTAIEDILETDILELEPQI